MLPRSGAPTSVAGMEVGPIRRRTVGEVVEPRGEHLLLILPLQRLYRLFECPLYFRPLAAVQNRGVGAVARTTEKWQPWYQHFRIGLPTLLFRAFFHFFRVHFLCLLEHKCCKWQKENRCLISPLFIIIFPFFFGLNNWKKKT